MRDLVGSSRKINGNEVVGGITGIEKEREEAASALEGWLKDLPDAFINVTGPRGSGKGALISEVMESHKYVLAKSIFCFAYSGLMHGLGTC